jgi:ABC-type molybdate transport system substrate-binding protein
MRERIEKGEHVDVFTSADIGHARKLVQDGRASVMAMFARNTVCLLSPAAFGATTETILDKLLAPGVRVGVSPAKVDPLGDYTVRLFEAAEQLRPGSAAALQARAVVLDTPPGAPPPKSGDTDADAITDDRVDVSIVYCSGRDRYARILMLLALTILSPVGQRVLVDRGFRPVTLPFE